MVRAYTGTRGRTRTRAIATGRRPGDAEPEARGGGGDGGEPEVLRTTHPAAVERAAECINAGGVIAIPTDTLYGLAVSAANSTAVHSVYAIKGRASTKPLAICVAEVADVAVYAHTEHLPAGLLQQLFPGPVTLVLKRRADSPLSDQLNPGVSGIAINDKYRPAGEDHILTTDATILGVRIPDAQFIRGVARRCGTALALTSANPSGQPSTVRVAEFRSLWPQCQLVCDGGTLAAGRSGSTVVDLTATGRFHIRRAGTAQRATVEVLRAFGLEGQPAAETE